MPIELSRIVHMLCITPFRNPGGAIACVVPSVLLVLSTGCLAPRPMDFTWDDEAIHTRESALVVTLGTWNIAGRGLAEHLALELEEVETDFLFLQEVHTVDFPPFEATVFDLDDGRWAVIGPINEVRSDGTMEAQVILSRYPILETGIVPLDRSGAKKRVALWANVDLGFTSLLLVNTDHEISLFRLGPDDRQKQVDSLLAYLESIDGRLPVLLGGDFNTGGAWLSPLSGISSSAENQRLYLDMEEAGFVPAFPKEELPLTFYQFPWPIRRTLDHLFARHAQPLHTSTHWRRDLSDHALVRGSFLVSTK